MSIRAWKPLCSAGAVFVLAIGLVACSGGAAPEEATATKAEYLAAAQAASECVRQKGFAAGDPEDAWGASYVVSVDFPDGEEEAAVDALDACWNKHAAAVEQQYMRGRRATGQERDQQYGEFVACLERAGVQGVKVGDEEGVVGAAIGENWEGIACMQYYLDVLFR